MKRSTRELLIDLVSPLTLAAYVAWATVWVTLSPVAAKNPLFGTIVYSCALLFLLVFVIQSALGDRLSLGRFATLSVVLALLGLTVCALAPQSAAPILMVLMVAMLASRVQGVALWLSLLLLNLGMALVIFSLWPGQPRWLAVSLVAHASFQVFAAIVMQTAKRAEAMSEQLRAVNADLIATRSLLEVSARDAERLRLSRELHDVAGHALTALKLNLGVLARDSRQPDTERVNLCAGLADDLLQNLRGVVRQMRAHEGIDLRATIEQLAAPFPKPTVQLDIATDARVHDIERAEALLRTVQEALTNAARHAGAGHLWLQLRRQAERIVLEIRDDGRGADPLEPGNGLRGMRERLRALGGDVTFDRGPEGGLRLVAELPASTA